MLLAALVSCGKDNKVSSNGAGAGIGAVITNPIISNSAIGQTLIANIDNPSIGFGGGIVPMGTLNTSTNCGVKWGIFTYCTYTSSGSGGSIPSNITWNSLLLSNPNIVYRYSTGRTVRNVDVSIASKQEELRSILNNASYIGVNGPVYYLTVQGVQYVIDVRFPIQLNPASRTDQNGTEIFIQYL